MEPLGRDLCGRPAQLIRVWLLWRDRVDSLAPGGRPFPAERFVWFGVDSPTKITVSGARATLSVALAPLLAIMVNQGAPAATNPYHSRVDHRTQPRRPAARDQAVAAAGDHDLSRSLIMLTEIQTLAGHMDDL